MASSMNITSDICTADDTQTEINTTSTSSWGLIILAIICIIIAVNAKEIVRFAYNVWDHLKIYIYGESAPAQNINRSSAMDDYIECRSNTSEWAIGGNDMIQASNEIQDLTDHDMSILRMSMLPVTVEEPEEQVENERVVEEPEEQVENERVVEEEDNEVQQPETKHETETKQEIKKETETKKVTDVLLPKVPKRAPAKKATAKSTPRSKLAVQAKEPVSNRQLLQGALSQKGDVGSDGSSSDSTDSD